MARDGSRGRGQFPEVVLFDALGTLVHLDDPFDALTRELAERGAPVEPDAARRALESEMAYYRSNHQAAGDRASLDDLRDRCVDVLRDALPPPARDLAHARLREALLASLRFRAFGDAAPALEGLRTAGVATAIVSNWDVSLHDVLAATGLAGLVGAVLTSAEEGMAKPDPQLFRRALERLERPSPQFAMHVGDDLEADVGGALAAGLTPVLIDRTGAGGHGGRCRVVRSLAELLPPRR